MVFFHHTEDCQGFFELGLWFWGRAGLFITPWVLDFDPNKMLVTKTSVWIRLIDFPLHFWTTQSLEATGNSIGKFLKIDIDRAKLGLGTFARIYMEVDLSKGLLEKIFLKLKNTKWMVQLDYENTTFWCWSCQQTRHPQDSSLVAWTATQKKKGNKPRNKRWNAPINSEVGDSEQEVDYVGKNSKQENEEDAGLEKMH